MISSPSGPYLRCIVFIQGNDRRHGTHHDAQKSTQTTLPEIGASPGGGAASRVGTAATKAAAMLRDANQRISFLHDHNRQSQPR